MLRSVILQAKAEQVLEQEKIEARISALQDLRSEFCRLIDEFITREEQTCLSAELTPRLSRVREANQCVLELFLSIRSSPTSKTFPQDLRSAWLTGHNMRVL